MTILLTADICDANDEALVLPDIFRSFGKKRQFSGKVRTLKTFEDNTRVREILEQPGQGKVLLIDGGGSKDRALVGGNLAKLAQDNEWEGIVVYGAIRDIAEIELLDIGIKAVCSQPRKSAKNQQGEVDVPIRFEGMIIEPGNHLISDEDGIVIQP